MTALERYTRLEATGYWCEAPDREEVEVLVSFGDATLVLSDFQENLLTHWAMAALQPLRSDEDGTIYSPDPSGNETLRIADADMNEAIGLVRQAWRFPKRRRKGRGAVFYGIAALAIAAAGVVWVPDLLRSQAASITEGAAARLLADRMMASGRDLVGPTCTEPRGLAASRKLTARLFAADAPRIIYLSGPMAPHVLPGGTLAVGQETLRALPNPEALAGLIAYLATGPQESITHRILDQASLRELATYIGNGRMPEPPMRALVAELQQEAAHWTPPADSFASVMGAAKLPTLDFAAFLGGQGAADAVVGQIAAADRMAGEPFIPALRDQDWVALREICVP